MSQIISEKNSVVSVHYRGTLAKNGEEFDNSADREPLTFMTGFRQMIPGFESELIGKSTGHTCTFTLSPDQAYGERDPNAVQAVPLAQLPDGVEVGDQLALQAPNGQVIPLMVREMNEESAMLDMNHALAGESLTFEVEIINVREANEEESANGVVQEKVFDSENDCCSSGTCTI